jgi:hypothetical protein
MRVNASKNRALLDFSSVDARSASAECVSHVFEIGDNARSLNEPKFVKMAVVVCAAVNCRNYHANPGGLSFFRFPKDATSLYIVLGVVKKRR